MMYKKWIITFFLMSGLLGGYAYMRPPMVSVVMPTYNRELLMPKAVLSILNQTYRDFEFIIVNDGSSDNTSDILRKLAAQDKRIKIVQNETNKGLIFSLNKGISMARGKYIARMDDDDFSLPLRFEKQVQFLEENPQTAVLGTFFSVANNLTPYSFQNETDFEKIVMLIQLGWVPISHPTVMIRRDFLKQNQIQYRDEKICRSIEDRCYWLDVIEKGGVINVLPEVLFYVRLHSTNSFQYYEEQYYNAEAFQKKVRQKFLTEAEVGLSDCKQQKRIIEVNRDKKIFNQQKLEEVVYAKCPNFKGEEVLHPHWNDAFVFNGNRFCREIDKTQCGVVNLKTDKELFVKWDQWSAESFVKNDEGLWTLKTKPE